MSDALLVLEDGTSFRGRSFGADGEAFGEAVFNTGMAGYEEVLTDPSYTAQVVTMTAPHIGNTGVTGEDAESSDVRVAAFVVREASHAPSSWRSRGPLGELLASSRVVAIEGIDTRALTLRIREGGAMRAGVSTLEEDGERLLARVRAHAGMAGADLAASVSTREPYEAATVAGPARPADGRAYRVAAYDFGLKRNILRVLASQGCEATVVPATHPPADVLAGAFDGVFLSNGPGDPAATRYGVDAARAFLEAGVPVFGICLGHQLLALALGAATFKLKYGHRGVNQPVLDLETDRVEVTSHNHGFAADARSWAGIAWDEALERRAAPVAEGPYGAVALTHRNLNDGTLEGVRAIERPAFGVQFHPEAAPGPHDASHLFARFRTLMREAA